MAKKVIGWFTMNGKHIPIYEGESKDDAVSRSLKDGDAVKHPHPSEKKSHPQDSFQAATTHGYSGADAKADALDEVESDMLKKYGLTEKNAKLAAKEIVDGADYDKTVKKYRNKNIADINEDIKAKQIAQNKTQVDKLSGKKSYAKENAKALGLDYDKVAKSNAEEYDKKYAEYQKLKTSGGNPDKMKELDSWLKSHKKSADEYKADKDKQIAKSEKTNLDALPKGMQDKLPGQVHTAITDTFKSMFKDTTSPYSDYSAKQLESAMLDYFKYDEDVAKAFKREASKLSGDNYDTLVKNMVYNTIDYADPWTGKGFAAWLPEKKADTSNSKGKSPKNMSDAQLAKTLKGDLTDKERDRYYDEVQRRGLTIGRHGGTDFSAMNRVKGR